MESVVKKMNCLKCEYANQLTNKCELTNKKLFLKGKQLTKDCNSFAEATWTCNYEREEDLME